MRIGAPVGGEPYRVLCIAGTDSAGCSGLAADVRTVAALGGHGQLAVTAVTVQDTRGVREISPLPARLVRAQIDAALADGATAAVKIGMLATARLVRAVAASLVDRSGTPVVLDPVLRSTTGRALLDDEGRRALLAVLLPLADLITPNIPEAEALLGHRILGIAGMEGAARELRELGARTVLVKGGHRRGDAVDVLVGADGTLKVSAPRLAVRNIRGTGCVLATACACFLAQGLPVAEAVRRGKSFVTVAIRHGYPLGPGPGPVNPTAAACELAEAANG